MSQALKKTAGHAGIYAVGAIFNRGVSFIMLPVYTRFLTPQDYGVLELLVLTVDIVAIFTGLGVMNGMHKFYYKYDTDQDRREVISTLFLLVIGFYTIACAIGVGLSGAVSRWVFEGEPWAAFLIKIAFANLLLALLVNVPLSYLQVRQKPVAFVLVSCAKLLLQVSLNIWFVVYLRLGVAGVLYSTLVALTLVGGGLTIYTFRNVGLALVRAKARELVIFGYPFVFTGFAAFLTTYSDRYFLNHYHDKTTVGLYSVAYRFGFLLMFFPVSPIFRIWNVQRFELARNEGYTPVFNRFLLWFTVVVTLAALGVALVVRDLLRVMAAPEFHTAWVVVPIILLAYYAQAYTDFFNFGIYHAGKSQHMAIGTGLAAAAILALSFLLIPAYGAHGAAWATIVAFAMRLSYVYLASQRAHRITYQLARPVAIFAVAVGLFLLWFALIGRVDLFDHLLYSIPLSATLLLAFPALLVVGRILPPEDRRLLIDLVRAPGTTLARMKETGT